MIIGKVHSGIAVKSLEVSVPFYTEVLGLELLGIEEPKRSRGDKLAVPGAFIQTAHFRVPGTDEEIELIEYKEPTPLFNYGVPVNTPGCVHIAFRVDDIEAQIAKMKEANVAFCSDNYETIVGGPIDGWKWIYFKDPDGTNMELIEVTKDNACNTV
ncbi:MAG: VOC family protein [Lentihominibacter sp.]|jgi:glyoxylase I family protein